MKLPARVDLRADTAWVIFQVLEQGKSSREVLALAQARHSKQDSAWLQEMAMGVFRHLPQLQLWLRELLNQPLKGSKKILEHLILLGFYQQAYSRVSDHAAVSATVNAAELLGGKGLKGLINAVLRNFQRKQLAQQLSEDPIIRSGLPKWLYKRIASAYPEQLDSILAGMNQPAPIWLRVNQQQCTKQAYCAALAAANIRFSESQSHPDAVILIDRAPITSLPGYDEGWFSVQDGAAQLAAPLLEAQAGERVLDCCAAPGGKTAHILERTPGLNHLIALDSEASRLKRMTENLTRLQLSAELVCADAAAPENWWDGNLFDRILLDAPCSATGVIRRHPDIRWLRKAADIETLETLQYRIFTQLWRTLKPGGTLVYATCSILPNENTRQVSRFLSEHSDASLMPIYQEETPERPGRQILPGEQQMDGFYYARLLKS
ncbi:16S rRNA (cytosine(967)-C(5))-methyltransferase RsmB [Alteromonas lipolytica]|uniref:16S rRNA (cytosine(967)-C(5))-methyltransferase n=1 Tax=Alteromonas lipolytica TaxID=1856405 RepID=A0A1E8FAP9_9ALTE|nr:16S rRNA (cytosine(967)-C(5))-methyltransferase RsmB [Alteromonas lipolytica]OFI32856.1 16S rRNA (cytosine(967)-C(5))-methyltransferase [Alteromonas lipolytica]GGF64735.1 ribosomal RNA small subunit methyltransferase B [Alteromonas lipolytica]